MRTCSTTSLSGNGPSQEFMQEFAVESSTIPTDTYTGPTLPKSLTPLQEFKKHRIHGDQSLKTSQNSNHSDSRVDQDVAMRENGRQTMTTDNVKLLPRGIKVLEFKIDLVRPFIKR